MRDLDWLCLLVAAYAVAWAVAVWVDNRRLEEWVERHETAAAAERAALIERLAIRTAETPVEAAAQARRAPAARHPHPAAEEDEYRRQVASRGVSPMGL